MELFEFTVNESFLHGAGHPITIPRSQIPYQDLATIGLNLKQVTIVLPRGEKFEAEIYHGEAGYGEYYQLRYTSSDRTLPSYLKLGDHLIVLLLRLADQSYAIVEYRE